MAIKWAVRFDPPNPVLPSVPSLQPLLHPPRWCSRRDNVERGARWFTFAKICSTDNKPTALSSEINAIKMTWSNKSEKRNFIFPIYSSPVGFARRIIDGSHLMAKQIRIISRCETINRTIKSHARGLQDLSPVKTCNAAGRKLKGVSQNALRTRVGSNCKILRLPFA